MLEPPFPSKHLPETTYYDEVTHWRSKHSPVTNFKLTADKQSRGGMDNFLYGNADFVAALIEFLVGGKLNDNHLAMLSWNHLQKFLI